MKTRFILFLSASIAIGLSAEAQERAAESPVAPAVSEAELGAPTKDAHTLAAEDLLEAMNMKETTQETVDQILEVQVQQQPQLAAFKDIMKTFLRKHLSYESIKDEMVQLYKSEFTAEELGQLAEFYRTPLGQKAVQKLAKLSAKGAQIGMQRVQANMGELQQAIISRQSEMQGGADQ